MRKHYHHHVMDNQQNQSADSLEWKESQAPLARIEKIQRYLGLLVAVALIFLVSVPVRKHSYLMFDNYFDRTTVGYLLKVNSAHGRRVIAQASVAEACADFVLDTEVEAVPTTRLRAYCSPTAFFDGLSSWSMGIDKLLEVEPTIKAKLSTFRALSLQDRETRGLVKVAMQPWTPELVTSARPLVIAMLNEYQRSKDWLRMARLQLSIFIVLLAVGCVAFRNEVGALILSPFRLLFGVGRGAAKVASEVHKRI